MGKNGEGVEIMEKKKGFENKEIKIKINNVESVMNLENV